MPVDPGRALREVRFFYFLFCPLIFFLASCTDSSLRKRSVTAIAWRPDGKAIVSGSEDKTIKVWEVSQSTGKWQCQSTLRGHSEENPDCTCQLHRGNGYEDYEQDPDCPVTGSYGSVNDLAFSGDGRMVIMAVSGRDDWNLNGTKLATGSIRLWDTGFRV